MKWLKSIELKGLDKETLTEYLITYEYLTEKIERLDNRIEERACQLKCVSFLFPLVFKGCSVNSADRYSGHF